MSIPSTKVKKVATDGEGVRILCIPHHLGITKVAFMQLIHAVFGLIDFDDTDMVDALLCVQ